ncbi:MAG TPA: alpha/beta hydrolase-fold protein [Fimbriiglobus sp.]|jgi:S-formylglutathione hydrolase FrmB
MRYLTVAAMYVALIGPATAQDAAPISFQLTVDKAALAEPFSGRVFVTFTRNEQRPVLRSLNWNNPEQTFALDVKDWKPGTPMTLGSNVKAFPKAMADLAAGRYYVQAVIDRDLGGISAFSSPGNIYSKAKRIEFDPKKHEVVSLTLDQTVEPARFRETENVKLVDIPSKLLSDFFGKPMRMRAGVALPASYVNEPEKKYPVVYEITGFGGDHNAAHGATSRTTLDGTDVIWVVLDANCRLGHDVFADSANNGPVGTALVKEMIPYVEKTYRGIGKPSARLVTGHSSGGWSSLWLQVAYPDTFGGCWSTSPDPVDFRDFQRINIYEPGMNYFTDANGKIRELSRAGRRGTALTFQKFSAMDDQTGRGGQLTSFEAVFSPKGADGKPMKLWDRKTGAIDTAVAKAWEKYDIRLKLDREWKTLGPKLAGKLHVWCGDIDTYYLDGAVRLLKKQLADLGSDAVVEMFPGKNHGLVDRTLRTRMSREMAETLKKGT